MDVPGVSAREPGWAAVVDARDRWLGGDRAARHDLASLSRDLDPTVTPYAALMAAFWAATFAEPTERLDGDRHALVVAHAVLAGAEASSPADSSPTDAARSMLPAMHLMLAEDHHADGEDDRAREQLAEARRACDGAPEGAAREQAHAKVDDVCARLGLGAVES